jgi:hypothetical protein
MQARPLKAFGSSNRLARDDTRSLPLPMPQGSSYITDRSERRLYRYMVEQARHRDRIYFASDDTAAAELGVSRRTIIRWRQKLEADGRIERDGWHVWGRLPNGAPRRTVRYRFLGHRGPMSHNAFGRSSRTRSRALRTPRYARGPHAGAHGGTLMTEELVPYEGALPDQPTARDVLALVIDAHRHRGLILASRTKGILAKQAKELLADGFDPLLVARACWVAANRGEPHNAWRIAEDMQRVAAATYLTRKRYDAKLKDEAERIERERVAEEGYKVDPVIARILKLKGYDEGSGRWKA